MAYLDHVDLVVGSIDRSLHFYRGLLEPLGWRWIHEVEGERGETIHYLFRVDGRGTLGLRAAQSERSAPHDRYEVGIHHLAFNAGSRGGVDRAAGWARQQEVEIESGPEEYAYQPGFYAVFLYDPDGIKLEIMTRARLPTILYALRPSTTPFLRRNRGHPR